MVLSIEGGKTGYSPDQCGYTMTVGELISFLENYDKDTKVFLNNDNGYSYGAITESSFSDLDVCEKCLDTDCNGDCKIKEDGE